MVKQTIYDPFTKITPFEKNIISRFLVKNQEVGNLQQTKITAALEAAVKDIPSFGGFIMTMSDEAELIAVVVVNHTGMERFGPGHIISYYATHKAHRNVGIGRNLLANTIRKLKGNVSLHLPLNNPDSELFQELGFEAAQVELQLIQRKKISKNNTSKIA